MLDITECSVWQTFNITESASLFFCKSMHIILVDHDMCQKEIQITIIYFSVLKLLLTYPYSTVCHDKVS